MNLFAAAAALQATDAEIHSLIRGDIDDKDVHPLLRGGMFSIVSPRKGSKRIIHRTRKANGKLSVEVEYAGYVERNLASKADTLFPLPPEPTPYNEELDAVHPTIEDSGRPGTSARIDAYREWYASHDSVSPNEGILDGDMEAELFLINVLSSKEQPTAKELKRREKGEQPELTLKEWLFGVATELHREALNAQ